jgi:hypothetical protein
MERRARQLVGPERLARSLTLLVETWTLLLTPRLVQL